MLAPGPGSQSITSASRPSLALQKLLAMTATPDGTCTTCSTPLTDLALLASNDFTFPPKTGDLATSAVRRSGMRTSIPNCAFPVIFSGVRSEEHTSELQSLAYLV